MYASLLILIGLALGIAGAHLVWLGGSLYYVVNGSAVIASGVLLWRGHLFGAWLYAAMLAGTLAWAVWEVGLDGWALMPRVLMWTVLGAWLLTPWARRGLR